MVLFSTMFLGQAYLWGDIQANKSRQGSLIERGKEGRQRTDPEKREKTYTPDHIILI